MLEPDTLLFQIGLTLLEKVGPRTAKKLIAYCGGAEAVFSEKSSNLLRIPGIGLEIARSISQQEVLPRAEKEVNYILRQDIRPLYYLNPDYPHRLKHCMDSPVMLYVSGDVDLQHSRIISLVGTRRASPYGKAWVEEFVEALKPYNPLVISGLAYGIDICAHRASLKHKIPTAGVLAHGLDRIYPSIHAASAYQMESEGGGLITEFLSGSEPDRENFPRRNRIVAGLSDAVVVVESDTKGGAIITAELANSYNRDVFAVPGPIGSPSSRGCNKLIKSNRAALIESVHDIEYIMGWTLEEKPAAEVQAQLFVDLSPEEESIVSHLQRLGKSAIDQLGMLCKMPSSEVAGILMALECSGVVRSLPGRQFSLS